jgi:cob(I)alamin adenosyltransferase
MKFSKKGDRGYTSLLGGQRIPKSGPRPEAYGTLDEASSALGIARASAARPKTKEIIMSIQKDLLVLGAELATAPEDLEKYPHQIKTDHVDRLERVIEDLQKDLVMGKEFILPGETVASAAIDLGRTIVRRAERKAVRLLQEKIITNGEVLRFLNRLADVLFILARYEEGRGKPCIPSSCA